MKSISEALKINRKLAKEAGFNDGSNTMPVLDDIVSSIKEKAAFKESKNNPYAPEKMLSSFLSIPGMDMKKISIDDFKQAYNIDEYFIKDDPSYRFFIAIGQEKRYFGKRFDGFLVDITNGVSRKPGEVSIVLYGNGTKDLSPKMKADRLHNTVVYVYTKMM